MEHTISPIPPEGVLFSVISSVRLWLCLSVCLSGCLSTCTITREPLEILSRNFQDIILWSNGRIHSKISMWGARVVRKLLWCSSYTYTICVVNVKSRVVPTIPCRAEPDLSSNSGSELRLIRAGFPRVLYTSHAKTRWAMEDYDVVRRRRPNCIRRTTVGVRRKSASVARCSLRPRRRFNYFVCADTIKGRFRRGTDSAARLLSHFCHRQADRRVTWRILSSRI